MSRKEEYLNTLEKRFNEIKDVFDLSKGTNEVPLSVMNRALDSHTSILNEAVKRYNIVKTECFYLKREFDSWWNDKFIEVKHEMNSQTDDKGKQIKFAVKEYDAEAMHKYKTEYMDKQEELTLKEYEMRYLIRIINIINGVTYKLKIMSDNSRSEMGTLYLSDNLSDSSQTIKRK